MARGIVFVIREAKRALEPAAAGKRDRDGTAVGHSLDPAAVEEGGEEGGAEGAGDVRNALAPVEAGGGEAAAFRLHVLQVDPELLEQISPRPCHLELLPFPAQRAALDERLREADAELAGEMVVARPRRTYSAADSRLTVRSRRSLGGQNRERLHRLHQLRPDEAVEAVTAFAPDPDQPDRREPRQMSARGRRGDARRQCQLAGRDLAAVRERHEHGDPRGVGEDFSDGGDGGVCKHISTLSQLSVRYAPRMINVNATSMDPAVVNATMEHVTLENDRVRAIEGILHPGDKEQMHSHPAFVTYVIAGGKIRNHFADGKVVEADLKTGDVLWRDPQTHWIENIGTTTLHFIVLELKDKH